MSALPVTTADGNQSEKRVYQGDDKSLADCQSFPFRRAEDVKAKAIAEAKEALIQAVEAEQDLENRYQGNFSLPEMRAAREARRQAVDALRKARQG